MATDIKKIIQNLFSFYDFTDKAILSVGAGGGQFIEYGQNSKHVYAVDNDKEALASLETSLQKSGFLEKFTLIHSDFFNVNIEVDVVMFEFSLHEIPDTDKAVKHALGMAPHILVNDHWPGSEWAYIVDEREKVAQSWEILNNYKFVKLQRYDAIQFFHDYGELYQKVKVQGANSIERIKPYKDKKNFTIPMSYGFALI